MEYYKRKACKEVSFVVVESTRDDTFDFDPSAFSRAGNATCPFCGTVADSEYVKRIGINSGFHHQPMAVICNAKGRVGKVYLPSKAIFFDESIVTERMKSLMQSRLLTIPDEPLEANPRSFDIQRYGFRKWRDVFTNRQLLTHFTNNKNISESWSEIIAAYENKDVAVAVYTILALSYSRLITSHNTFSYLNSARSTIEGPWGDAKFPMTWDFVEANMFSGASASYENALNWVCDSLSMIATQGLPAIVKRCDATQTNYESDFFDIVVTDPPYYDSVSYSNLADAFYVWLKRSIGNIHNDDFAGELTPKKREAIQATYRHNGDSFAANRAYEKLMAMSLSEANRVLKPGGLISIVYAHKTTLGWSTLVDALRKSDFTIVEAWPIVTEMRSGRKKLNKAMLASSIFLVARKREINIDVGQYENNIQPELVNIVRERVETLWEMGISGADLVISAVGAGLRAFTRYGRVEYANGEEVPAEKFLAEVEGVVLDIMMTKVFGTVGGNVSAVDPNRRFYVLWRYVYKTIEIEAGEAIVFTYGQQVELDGQHGLSSGRNPLIEKKKGKYRARDFFERGQHDKLGLHNENGESAPLIDVLHRVLWLIENSPRKLAEFLLEAQPDRERLRIVAQALAGAALSGKSSKDTERLVSTTPAEQAALAKLLANWKALIPESLFTDT